MQVFQKFDLDGSGFIEAAELMLLGKQRRLLGHKQSSWTDRKNTELIEKMDEFGQ